ncbi:hypothetical protein DIPPA_26018 [Diplonema papillatum]|nr:hypothetical protein DIPPA_26018 [Diplonema papillatum]
MASGDDPQPIGVPERYRKNFLALENMDVYFIETVQKVLRKQKLHTGVIVVMRSHLYSCYEDGQITRCVRIPTVSELTVQGTDVVVRLPGDYDLWVRFPSNDASHRFQRVLSQLYIHSAKSHLPIKSVPPNASIGDAHHPVQLTRPDNKPIYLDPMTQLEPPLERPPPPPSLLSEADTRHKARGVIPAPPSVESDDAGTSVGAPPPPPPDDDELPDDAFGAASTSRDIVTSGSPDYPVVELLPPSSQPGVNPKVTHGVVTLSRKQLAAAHGGPIKINLQIVHQHGEASSRASSQTSSRPPPPSRGSSAIGRSADPSPEGYDGAYDPLSHHHHHNDGLRGEDVKTLPTPPHAPGGRGAAPDAQQQWKLGKIVTLDVPTADGGTQRVQLPEACVPNVEALIEQIQEAQDNLRRKDTQLSAVLSLAQKNDAAKKDTIDNRVRSLTAQVHGAEDELARVRGELHDTKSRLIREKEAHLHQLARGGGGASPALLGAIPPSELKQLPNYSPGGRVRISPPRGGRGAAEFQLGHLQASACKPPAQPPAFPARPAPAAREPESDWAVMSRICQDISQRIDNSSRFMVWQLTLNTD